MYLHLKLLMYNVIKELKKKGSKNDTSSIVFMSCLQT